jgi:sugar lactone lactonase YvrE
MNSLIGLVLVLAIAIVPGIAKEPRKLKVGEKPESVCRGFGGRLYVTMIGGETPGDGTIKMIDGENVSVFAKGFNAPKGIAFVGGFLVAADEQTVWKVNSKGEASKLAEASSFPRPVEFLNDVAASLDGKAVYVTDMSSPKPMFDPSAERRLWPLDSPQAKELPSKGCVYRVGLDGKVTLVVPPGDKRLGFPNGVTVTGTKRREVLVMGDFFTGNIVSSDAGKLEVIATGLRGADAVELDKDVIYVSSWPLGKVWAFDRKTSKTKVLIEGLTTAADFFHDRKGHQLVIPDMLEGTLTFLPLD